MYVAIVDDIYTDDNMNLFRDPAKIIVTGFSNSGKTALVSKLLKVYAVNYSKIIICGVSYHPLQDDVSISPKLLVSKDIVDPLEKSNPLDKILLVLDDMYLKAMQS